MLRRAILPCCLVLVLTVLAACQVRPLYGPVPAGEVNPRSHLAAIDIAPVRGRTGQIVRNELDFLLNAGEPGPPVYTLSLQYRTRDSSSIIHRLRGEPTNRTLSLQVDYRLTSTTEGTQLLRGRVVRSASYEISRQRLANDRAALDAAERAAREAAEELRIRLATFFVSDGAAQAHLSPEIVLDEDDFPLIEDIEDDDLDF